MSPINLNADLGESFGAWTMGSDAELHCVHGILERLRKPWFAVPGNHETTWSESACTTFGRLFGNDGRLAFRAGGYLFVGFTAAGHYQRTENYSGLFIFATVGNFVAIIIAVFFWKMLTDRDTPLAEVDARTFRRRFAVGVAILFGST